jgi:hypothetical protein
MGITEAHVGFVVADEVCGFVAETDPAPRAVLPEALPEGRR